VAAGCELVDFLTLDVGVAPTLALGSACRARDDVALSACSS